MFSPKDIPFMSVWLVCTYLSFMLLNRLINNKNINNLRLILFSIATAYLIQLDLWNFNLHTVFYIISIILNKDLTKNIFYVIFFIFIFNQFFN